MTSKSYIVEHTFTFERVGKTYNEKTEHSFSELRNSEIQKLI